LPGFHARSRKEALALDDPLKREIAARVFDDTHYEVGVSSRINRMLVTPPQRIHTETRTLPHGEEQTTGSIDTPEGALTFETRFDPAANTSWQVKYPVESLDDLEKIASVPWERPEQLAPPTLDGLPADFEARGIVSTHVSTPFVCVAGMMPYQMFLEMAATHMDTLQQLTEICVARILDCLEVLFSRPGIEYVWMGGSEWVTPPMGSVALYDALVQEQERRLIDFVKRRSDAVVHVHCHGRVGRVLERTIARGADYTEPVEPPPDGDITMPEAKRLVGGRITLGGNVECRVLCNECEHVVEDATRAAFDGGKERFVLRPTEGPSPRLREQEFRNYMRLIDVWEDLSPL
jgi:hypothetical protein